MRLDVADAYVPFADAKLLGDLQTPPPGGFWGWPEGSGRISSVHARRASRFEHFQHRFLARIVRQMLDVALGVAIAVFALGGREAALQESLARDFPADRRSAAFSTMSFRGQGWA